MREMKDSGIEWIGEMPKGWTINRIKNLFSNCKGLSITKENLIDNGLPVISYGQIHSKENDGTSIKKCLLRYVDYSYQKNNPKCEVRKNDFVFADTSEDYEGCGNCVYKRDDTLLFGGYHSIILHSICNVNDNRYLAYLFKTDSWRKQIRETASGVKVYSVTQKALMNTSVILPPLPEQKSIADFLDIKCSEIDGLISDIQKQIITLEEYKRSVITEAVTKGLNPDAEMKDSGIEWIGEIPKGWSIIATKYLYKIEAGATPKSDNPNFFDGNIVWVTPADYKTEDVYISSGRRNISQLGFESCSCTLVPIGSIIFSKRAPIGTVAINTVELCTNQGCLSCISKTDDITKYYYYVMSIGTEQYNLFGSGTTFKEISAVNFSNFSLPRPNITEQKSIVDFLDSKCTEIDSIISEKKKQIETIEEYKKSLIFEYVTGKKEVYVNE